MRPWVPLVPVECPTASTPLSQPFCQHCQAPRQNIRSQHCSRHRSTISYYRCIHLLLTVATSQSVAVQLSCILLPLLCPLQPITLQKIDVYPWCQEAEPCPDLHTCRVPCGAVWAVHAGACSLCCAYPWCTMCLWLFVPDSLYRITVTLFTILYLNPIVLWALWGTRAQRTPRQRIRPQGTRAVDGTMTHRCSTQLNPTVQALERKEVPTPPISSLSIPSQ